MRLTKISIIEKNWEKQTRKSLQQQGGLDKYKFVTSLHIQGMKGVNGKVLPIILETISKENNNSGRPLQLELGKPTIMQEVIKLVLVVVAARLLHRLS